MPARREATYSACRCCAGACGRCIGGRPAVSTSQPPAHRCCIPQAAARIIVRSVCVGGLEGRILFAMHVAQRHAGRRMKLGTHEAARAGAARRGQAAVRPALPALVGSSLAVPPCCTWPLLAQQLVVWLLSCVTTWAGCRLAHGPHQAARSWVPGGGGGWAAAAAGRGNIACKGCCPLCSACQRLLGTLAGCREPTSGSSAPSSTQPCRHVSALLQRGSCGWDSPWALAGQCPAPQQAPVQAAPHWACQGPG